MKRSVIPMDAETWSMVVGVILTLAGVFAVMRGGED